MAKRLDTNLEMRNVPPINWTRGFVVGAIGAVAMMGLVDIFNMAGFTPFSFEVYIGSLIVHSKYATHAWTTGFIANLIFGGLFGVLYGYFFEYIFRKSDLRTGLLLGGAHALVAAAAFFPFFNVIHEFYELGLYGPFGFLGSAIGMGTFTILLFAHLFFGATMGALYGPVRMARLHMASYEPGETGMPGERGVISAEEDPEDRMAI